MPIIDYITYYYSANTVPFRCITELPDGEAVCIMEKLYMQYKGSLLFERFSNPSQYLQNRRQTENWTRTAFLERGGRPAEQHPVSMVLGSSEWIENHAPDRKAHAGIRIPLSLFSEADISFTFPDSMVSWWLGNEKPKEFYLPEYHGRVFTKTEILTLVGGKGLPENNWDIKMPNDTGAYIEAQVWNRSPLTRYIPTGSGTSK